MKMQLLYSIIILLFFGCKPKAVMQEKVKKIAVHTFTGKGEHDETTTWFYIKNVVDRGFSGYYLESTSKVDDFKEVNFVYSPMRPLKFKGEAATDEKLQFLDPNDLPDNILKDSSHLEYYISKP